MLQRAITPQLLKALTDRPVVLLQGARQTGKSTLARWIAEKRRRAEYLTLDHAAVLSAATTDPEGFIAGFDGPVVLDEVQHAPQLFRAIKAAVDRDRKPGRFLLTGSANILLTPKVSESLAGRVEVHTLAPLSQNEIEGRPARLIDAIFEPKLNWPSILAEPWGRLTGRMARGGYPEVVTQGDESRRRAWFDSYITTILQRDVREMANVQGLTDFPRLLTLLATRATSLLNYSDVSRDLAMPLTTLKRYTALLHATFLVQTLPAWSTNLGKRLVKAAKLLINDTGLLCHLLGADHARLRDDRVLAGRVLENFIAVELQKQAAWSDTQPKLFHMRTLAGREVDLVLESPAGRIVGIEIKSSTTIGAHDFKGLRHLAETAGKNFLRGVVLNPGPQIIPFAANLHAVPISALWRM